MAKTGSPLLKRKAFTLPVCLFVLALVVRLIYLTGSLDAPTHDLPIVDSLVYHQAAAQLAEGGGFSDTFFFQPFLYPWLLSFIYWMTGSSIVAAKIIQIVLGSLTCLITFFVTRRLFGLKAAWAAWIVILFYGPLIFFETELLATGLAAFFSVTLVMLFLKAEEKPGVRFFLLLGLASGLAVLTRPTFLPVFIAGLVWLSWKTRRVYACVIPLLGFALPVLLVAFLNQHVTGQFGFLPSSGGLNLYLGNNPNYEETVNARPGSQWSDVIDLPRRHGIRGDMWARQDFFREQVKRYAASDPLSFTSGLMNKGLQFVSSRETARNVDIYLFRRWSVMLSLLVWKLGAFGFPFGLLLPLAVIGLIRYFRETPIILPLSALVYALAIVLVFVASRYRAPVVPLLCVMAGPGLMSVVQTMRSRDRLGLAGAAGMALIVVLLGTVPGPFVSERMDYEPELYCCLAETLQQSGRLDEAIERFEQAIELNDNYADAHANVATLYMYKGRIDEAVRANERALEIKPDFAQAHANLAAQLTNVGRYDEAIEHCEKGLQIRPHEEAFHFNLARVYVEQRRMGEARRHLEKALELNPHHGASHFELARFLEREGRVPEAIEHYKSAGEFAPDMETFFLLANLLVRTGRYDQAIEPLRHAVSISPENPAVRHTLALALASSGRPREAVKEYLRVIEVQPDYVPSLCGLAWLKATHPDSRMRDGEEALAWAERAARIDGSNPNVLNTLAAAHAEAGSFDKAVETAKAAKYAAERAGLMGFAQEIAQRIQEYGQGRPLRVTH